jgi:predicted RNA-binding protein YlqC (UPF0109 family)
VETRVDGRVDGNVEGLVRFLAHGLVSRPDDVHVSVVEGETVVIVELHVHDSDLSRIHGPEGRTLRALRQVLSASSGRRKAMLEVVDAHAGPASGDAGEE